MVDASVAAKWFVTEIHSDTALTLIDGRNELYAPDFLSLEMDSVFCKWIRRGTIQSAEAARTRSAFRSTPIQYVASARLQDAAYDLANQTQRSLYDSLYVAAAVSLDIPLVTADRRLYDTLAASHLRQFVLWVEDIP